MARDEEPLQQISPGEVEHRINLETKIQNHTSSPQNSLVAKIAQHDQHPFLSRHACEQLLQMLPCLHRTHLVSPVAIAALRAMMTESSLDDVNAWAAAHLWMSKAPGLRPKFNARRWRKL